MMCPLTRWLISRSLDTGKKMPGFAARHAQRCGACREYARFAESLPARFSGELPSLLADVPEAPPLALPSESKEERFIRSPRMGIRRFIRPVPVAALALFLVAGIFLFRQIVGGPGIKPGATLADLKSLITIPRDVQAAAVQAESPLVQERLLLEKSVLSAFEYLQARLNIKIERKDSRST